MLLPAGGAAAVVPVWVVVVFPPLLLEAVGLVLLGDSVAVALQVLVVEEALVVLVLAVLVEVVEAEWAAPVVAVAVEVVRLRGGKQEVELKLFENKQNKIQTEAVRKQTAQNSNVVH